MSTLGVVLVVLAVLLVALFVGGYLANARRRAADRARLERLAADADQSLALARAEDRGWERSGLEAAARAALERRHPGAPGSALTLVQVVDRPGTDEDEAVFEAARGERVVLGRRGGEWVARE